MAETSPASSLESDHSNPAGSTPITTHQSTLSSVFSWRLLLPLILVVLLSSFLRWWRVASIPLERDEGEYAYIAQRWLAGDLPYRDAFDQKPPGTFLAYTVLFALGCKSIEAIHWLGHLSLVGTLVFVYLIGRRLFSHLVGWLAALALVLFTMDQAVRGSASNTEVFAILPLSAGMYFSLRAGEKGRWFDCLVAGLCGGLALCFKQITLPSVVFFAGWILVNQRRPLRGDSARAGSALSVLLGAFAAGIFVIWMPICLYFVVHGAWGPFFDCVVLHNLIYSSQVSPRFYGVNFYQGTLNILFAQWPFWIAVVVGLWVAFKRGTVGMRPCLWWWLSAFLGVCVGGYFRQHYFILVLPAVSLVAAYGLEVLGKFLEPKRIEWQPRVAVILAAGTVAWPLLSLHSYYFAYSSEQACRRAYGTNPFPESLLVAKFLRERSTADDKVFIMGSEPQILFYAERTSASRYIFVYPLFGGARDAESRQHEVMRQIRERLPRFLVIVNEPKSFAALPGAPTYLVEEVQKLVTESYSFVAVAVQGMDGTSRVEQPVVNADGSQLIVQIANMEFPSLTVWERRD